MHNDFTLFLREYPNGKKVFFYYAYDKEGRRRGPWTTKSMKKTAARNYCNGLLLAGELIPGQKKVLTFGDYAKGFWERGSEYIENQESRADITDSYIETCQRHLTNQILPFFGKTPLDKITDDDVNKWLLGFKKREVVINGKPKTTGYKNTYANSVFGTLTLMMGEAVKRKLISQNPCGNVSRLKNDRKKMEILTVEEAQKLFPDDYAAVWGDKEAAYIANKLASLTGMRIGEILGMRGEFVFDDYIYVCGQYTRYGYGPTKTKANRKIPLIPEMIALLRKLMEKNGAGYVFSFDGGAAPAGQTYISRAFQAAMINTGISGTEIKRRGLTVHGWRHFLNTELLRQGLTIEQIQVVTGHITDGMTTDRYNHLDARQLADVMKAQQVIAGNHPGGNGSPPENPETSKMVSAGPLIVNFPQKEILNAEAS